MRLYFIFISVIIFVLNLLPASTRADLNWSSISGLSSPGQDSEDPQIAVSNDGSTAVAVWRRFDGLHAIIQSRVAALGASGAVWGPVNDISESGQNSDDPQIAISADGTKAAAIWTRSNGVNDIIQASFATISEHTAVWGGVSDLSAALHDASYGSIKISADGTRASAIWTRHNGSSNIIQTKAANLSGNTAVWGPLYNLSSDGQGAFRPGIAISADGTKATTIWRRHDGSYDIVQTRSAMIGEVSTSWGDVLDLSETGQNADYPQIALSADGAKATAIWNRNDGANFIIQTRSATIEAANAVWGSVSEQLGRFESQPQISLSADGTTAASVWWYFDGFNNIIQTSFAAVSGNSANWSSASDLSATGQNAELAQIAMAADGSRAVAIWIGSNGFNALAQGRLATFAAGTPSWSTLFNMSAAGQNAEAPRVGISADGTRVAGIWRQTNGANYIIQAVSASEPDPTPTPTPTTTPTIPAPTPTPTSSPTPIILPDLLVTKLTGPVTWKRGASGTVAVTVQNQGSLDVRSKILVHVYLSSSSTLQIQKAFRIGQFSAPLLLANSNQKKVLRLKLSNRIAARKYYLFANIDPLNSISENDESNNTTRAAKKITVRSR